ncbi:MAG TPA: asparagine synthase-related protein [Steroidobacteraceae bacterium]|nr:asparagine synthase-related protein [Steroidobacteraceae bacterium]
MDLAKATVIQCVIGDFAEVSSGESAAPWVNSTVVRVDLERSLVTIFTSLTGLPPVFSFRERDRSHYSCPFIPSVACGALAPDLDGIADTLRWGHPLDGRTLFADLSLIPSASTIVVTKSGEISDTSNTESLDAGDFDSLTLGELIEEQLLAFDKSAARFRPDHAFLSLSGGLDSRTALVGLIKHERRVPCVTMTGAEENLDSRLARAFCRTHGLEHHAVILGDEFLRRLPDLALESAGLTGGISCLSQSADLYLYAALGRTFAARISGNLGNQVGRGGVEGLGAYDPVPDVFCPEVRERLASRPKAPWFMARLDKKDYGEMLFCQEAQFTSVANYVVGSSRAVQLTPYADRRLLQLSRAAFAHNRELSPPTARTLRTRDLRHRFAGTPKSTSFQRRFLIEYDARGRNIPLNWGWYASGGWSLKQVLASATSAADAAVIKLSRSPTAVGVVAKWIAPKLRHRSDMVYWPPVLKRELRALALDSLNSQTIRHMGIFDDKSLNVILQQHFETDTNHHYTVFRCLEICLGLLARASSGHRAL